MNVALTLFLAGSALWVLFGVVNLVDYYANKDKHQ